MARNDPRVDVDLIRELLTTNTPTARIAALAGCSDRQVLRYKRDMGLTVRPNALAAQPISQERLAAIEERLNDGWSVREISRHLHVHEETITRHFPGSSWGPELRREYIRLLRQLKRLPNTIDEIRRQRSEYGVAA